MVTQQIMLWNKQAANKSVSISIKKQTWASLVASCDIVDCCHKLFNVPEMLEDKYINGGIFDWTKKRDKKVADNHDNTFIHNVRTHWAIAHEGDPTGYVTRKNVTKCNPKVNDVDEE